MRDPRIDTASAQLIALKAKRIGVNNQAMICTLAADAVEHEALAEFLATRAERANRMSEAIFAGGGGLDEFADLEDRLRRATDTECLHRDKTLIRLEIHAERAGILDPSE